MYKYIKDNTEKAWFSIIFIILLTSFLLVTVVFKNDDKVEIASQIDPLIQNKELISILTN